MTRYVTDDAGNRVASLASLDPTPLDDGMEGAEDYRIYRLCQCDDCSGTGKTLEDDARGKLHPVRCTVCRGEGKNLSLLATATDAQSVGVALVTLAEEDEFDGCPMGLMRRPEGQPGKWLVKPWLASPRNVSDAGKLLRSARTP